MFGVRQYHEDGWVYSSDTELTVVYGIDKTLSEVLRWIRWFAMTSNDISPRGSLADLWADYRGKMATMVEERLVRLPAEGNPIEAFGDEEDETDEAEEEEDEEGDDDEDDDDMDYMRVSPEHGL
ncbi:uncharacterized protein EV422DRAFT_567272 [Fimicolochytrium jonesii]|uniref:uncharacterized protein n=1 Tax=Fimicolochytrium jonesii TaxID=1396493 RepID=UPI0022FDEE23|nr:uncharacterized protein EV422DRAFT_567272 [Fimicolochytrium jonesii]KAI8820943.1 hypothetical protein EV422DRAFT_567272 [Fimicolochytrium jonesii]